MAAPRSFSSQRSVIEPEPTARGAAPPNPAITSKKPVIKERGILGSCRKRLTQESECDEASRRRSNRTGNCEHEGNKIRGVKNPSSTVELRKRTGTMLVLLHEPPTETDLRKNERAKCKSQHECTEGKCDNRGVGGVISLRYRPQSRSHQRGCNRTRKRDQLAPKDL